MHPDIASRMPGGNRRVRRRPPDFRQSPPHQPKVTTSAPTDAMTAPAAASP
jgi:hypothetical protein